MTAYRNISFATADSLRELLHTGSMVLGRGGETRELRNRVTTLQRPRERCLFLPNRNHDVFGQVAETIWVMAGRNDVPWLARYLDRAPEFSEDDGATWRGGYGPRLRRWADATDQVAEWVSLFRADAQTRRAAGVLFDPARDFAPSSRDIPCTNWLSWLIRDGRLHLNIAIRSNDVIWGFSGINAFEWSVLHEMLSFWLGVEVGDATYFATSYHLYEKHYARAQNIVSAFTQLTPYDYGICAPAFSTPWDELSDAFDAWFITEAGLRADPSLTLPRNSATADPLLGSMLSLLRLKWGAPGWDKRRLSDELASMPENDLTLSAYEYFGRSNPSLLEQKTHPNIREYFTASRSNREPDAADLKSAISTLHARKNAGYAGSWKRRGERMSILPNIARKVDRLQVFFGSGAAIDGEAILDTGVDLLVYAIKYALFLAEQGGADASCLPVRITQPDSDSNEQFDLVLQTAQFNLPDGSAQTLSRRILSDFETSWTNADAGIDLRTRQAASADLMAKAVALVSALRVEYPAQARAFILSERALGA